MPFYRVGVFVYLFVCLFYSINTTPWEISILSEGTLENLLCSY